jgi:hypothetical protein
VKSAEFIESVRFREVRPAVAFACTSDGDAGAAGTHVTVGMIMFAERSG